MNKFQEAIRNHLNDAEGLRIYAKELIERAFAAGLWKPETERNTMINDVIQQLQKEIDEVSGGSANWAAKPIINSSVSVAGETVENRLKQHPVADEEEIRREPTQNQIKRKGDPK